MIFTIFYDSHIFFFSFGIVQWGLFIRCVWVIHNALSNQVITGIYRLLSYLMFIQSLFRVYLQSVKIAATKVLKIGHNDSDDRDVRSEKSSIFKYSIIHHARDNTEILPNKHLDTISTSTLHSLFTPF